MPPEQVRWAIAGNRQKLEAVKDAVGAAVDVLVADSQDQQAIDAIVAQTRVLPPPPDPLPSMAMRFVPAFGSKLICRH